LTLAAVGAVGFVLWKALWLLLLPLFGALVGFALLFAKWALFALVVFVIWRLFFRKPHPVSSTD
jgi:hypothetical protein